MRDEVVFVTQVMPHYREGVFRHVQGHCSSPVRWVTGRSSADGVMRQIAKDAIWGTKYLKNRWKGPYLWQSGLQWELLRSRPRVVVFTGDVHFISTWVAAGWLRLFTRTTVLFWTMGWRAPDRGLVRIVRLAFYRLAHALLLYGNIGLKAGVQSGYPVDRMFVIYNGLSDESGDAPRPELMDLPSPNGATTFGAVARLNANKRFVQLVDAVALLNSQGLHSRIVLAGTGAEDTTIASRAAELNVQCYMVGAVYGRKGLASVYDELDVTVVPGAIGLTAIQSLQHGTPVVTSGDLSLQGPEVEAVTSAVGTLLNDDATETLAGELRRWITGERIASTEVCRREYETRWNSESSGEAILRVIERVTGSHWRV